MDVTADTDGLREEVDRKLARAFDLNVDLALPSRQSMQAALDRKVGRGLKLFIDELNLPGKKEMQAQLDTKAGKGLKLKIAGFDLPLKRAMQVELDQRVGTGLKLKVNIDVDDTSFIPVIAKTEAAQKAVTSIEAREQLKRETARQNATARTVEALLKQQGKLAADRELLEDRTNARLEVLNDQHFNRLNSQTAAAALRREVIESNLNARLTAQNDAFEKRRAFALEAGQRKIQAQANKPILQSVLINANELNRSLADFDRTVSRVLLTSLLSFTVWSAGVEAAVAAAAGAAVVSFAKVELAATQTASVVAAQTVSDEIIAQGHAISDFSTIVDREFDRVIEKADEVALTTLFDTGDIVGSIDAAVKAGQSLDDAMQTVAASANFAQVNQLDAADASEQLAAGMAAAGIEADKSAGLIDKISFVAASALGDANDYLEAFANRAAASAKAFGYTNDEVLVFLSLLGQTGTLGREAGTQANIVFRELGRAAGRASEAWKKYGIEANAPLAEQLVQLAKVAESTRKIKGRAGVAGLAQELGLTYKSISSILQVLPQVNKLGLEGLNNLERGIKSSGGLVDQQAEQVRHTIAYQWDNLLNTTAIASRKFASKVAPALSTLFDVFAGKGGLINQAEESLESFGDTMSGTVKRVTSFVQTPAFVDGVETMVEAIEVTLSGVSDAFAAFSEAFDGASESQSTFESIADTMLAFARTSAAVLPVVARILGQIFDFLIDNAEAFETFAKLTLGVYAARKAFTLLVVPALTAFNAIDKARNAMIAWSAAETVGPFKSAAVMVATRLGIITTQADLATAAIGRLTTAEVINSTASIGAGTKNAAVGAQALNFVPLRKIPLRSGQAEQITKRAAVAGVDELGSSAATGAFAGNAAKQTKGMAAALSKLNPELVKTSGLLRGMTGLIGKLGIIGAIIAGTFDVAVGAVSGFREEWSRLMDKDNGNIEEFKSGLSAIGTLLGWLGDALGFVSDVIREQGAKWGRAMADAVFLLVSSIGYAIKFVKAAKDAIVDSFFAIVREVGDAIAGFERSLAAMLTKMGRVPGGGKFKEWATELNGAADAADKWGQEVESAAKKTENALMPIPKWLRNTRDSTWELNQEWVRNQKLLKVAGQNAGGAAKRIADAVLSHIPGATAALKNFNEALRTAAANKAADTAFNSTFNKLTGGRTDNLTPDSQVDVLTRAGNAAAVARIRVLGLYPAAKLVAKASKEASGALASSVGGDDDASLAGAATTAAASTDKLTTAADRASAAVDNMSGKAFQAQAVAAIGKATNAAAGGYKATRVEAEVLKRVLPGLEKELEGQRTAVQRLDDALTALQSTQLKGTKAFSDQQFGLDQQSKALELQRLDLIIGGTSEEDPAVKAIDDQIAALRNQADRARLVESLQLDPLRKKLEDTFQPVKELGFDEIMSQFKKLNGERAPLVDAITGGENLKAVLEKTIGDAEQRFEGAGKQVSAGLARGIVAGTKGVADAGTTAGNQALAGLNKVMDFGSPSKTMHAQGVWVSQGLAQGIAAATPQIVTASTSAGSQVMAGFLAGLKSGFGAPETVGSVAWYLNVFIPDWIRKNKGPISYDQGILVPAGHAVMEGFGKGLRDGFGQVAGFVKEVGPQLGEMIGGKEFSARTATILADVALGKTPDIEAALGDLRPAEIGYGDFSGPFDPTLSFLHRSLSYEDTKAMAQQLASMFGVGISAMRFDHSKYTIDGNISRHGEGLAADLSNGSQPTPEMDALYAALLPLKGKVFDELLYKTMVGGNHFNHVHAAWLRGSGFGIDSGKKGGGFDIPGVGGAIEAAINAAAMKYHLPAQLIAAVAKQESGFRPNVVSPDGGYGLMQLTSAGLVSQAKAKGNIFDPFVNVDVGSRYLKTLLEAFDGNTFKALMGYNGGPGAAANPFAAVIRYANSVLSIMRDFGGARELGGPTQAGKAYLVGERGPELHVPSRNGHVIPADQTSRILSGGSTPQYIDNSVTNVTTAATDADIVAEKIDRKKKDRLAGVNFR